MARLAPRLAGGRANHLIGGAGPWPERNRSPQNPTGKPVLWPGKCYARVETRLRAILLSVRQPEASLGPIRSLAFAAGKPALSTNRRKLGGVSPPALFHSSELGFRKI